MQKKIIALAIAGLASTAAFAQTNVTIYGIADASVSATTGLGSAARQSQFNVNSGSLSTSRIGFKGVEDLGNGLKALFTLEYGLAIDASAPVGTSTTTSAVARQQFVGLTGGFGTLIAGHLQTTGLDFTVAGSALGGSTTFGVANQGAGLQGNVATHLISAQWGGRHSNAIAYVSPSFGGLTVAYNHARVSEAAAASGASDTHGDLLSVSYANGPVTAGAIVTAATAPSNAGVANANVYEAGVRFGFDAQVVKLQTQWQTARAQNPNAVTNANPDRMWLVSATVPLGKTAFIAEYANYKIGSTRADDNINAVSLTTTYAMSKRTTAYAGVVMRRVDNSIGTGNQFTTTSGDTNFYGMGLRHMF